MLFYVLIDNYHCEARSGACAREGGQQDQS